jgi:predicted metal-dependent phosphoesterase TrpH
MIDLHSHTNASDGQHAPAAQVALAAKAGVTVLAVTDHDTVMGLEEAFQQAASLNVRLVPGIELSCELHRREVHILGHFVDPHAKSIARVVTRLRDERCRRMQLMIDKLRQAGVPITLDDVEARAGNAPLTRPHLATLLVDMGMCTSVKEAFSRFLGDKKLAWVPKANLAVSEAIDIIRHAGGTATVAHPGSSKINHLELSLLAGHGVSGIEVFHTDHPPSQRDLFEKWAREFDLCSTAGSDFHGARVAPDRPFGTVQMTAVMLQQLESRRP